MSFKINSRNPKLDSDDQNDLTKNKMNNDNKENSYKNIKPVYFVFLDVLGFKQDYKLHKSSKEVSEKYSSVFSKYSDIMDKYLGKNKDEIGYAGQTSDSLYFYTERIDFLVDFLKIYAYFSLYAMTKGVFFRGGVAKGELYFKNSRYQFYGDSVIGAYLIESNIAEYPRVVLDISTTKEIKDDKIIAQLIKFEEPRGYINPFTKAIFDYKCNIRGIDYDELDIDKIACISKIKYVINNKIKENEYEPRICSKYQGLLKDINEYERNIKIGS